VSRVTRNLFLAIAIVIIGLAAGYTIGHRSTTTTTTSTTSTTSTTVSTPTSVPTSTTTAASLTTCAARTSPGPTSDPKGRPALVTTS